MADKLQSQIELRERRLAELERRERFVRYDIAEREKEQPLRRSRSRSKDRIEAAKPEAELRPRPMVFETDAERESALRRRQVIN